MDESSLLFLVAGLAVGFLLGIVANLVYNKLRTGSLSVNKLNQEKQQYQADVEAHFEETSRRFKAMTEQYQEFYEHLSKGATTLCSAETQSKLLIKPSLQGEPKEPNVGQKAATKKSMKSVGSNKGSGSTRASGATKKVEPIKAEPTAKRVIKQRESSTKSVQKSPNSTSDNL